MQADAVGFARILPDADHDLGVGDDGLDVVERRALAHSTHGELALPIGDAAIIMRVKSAWSPRTRRGGSGFQFMRRACFSPSCRLSSGGVKFWSRGASGRPAGTKAQNLASDQLHLAVSPSSPACA